ncbi:CHAT domain-containing protein, partial [bacterium]|nr:CHAT domain-containing protein [bacterium]
MERPTFLLQDNILVFRWEQKTIREQTAVDDGVIDIFFKWIARYQEALEKGNPKERLLSLGREMFDWLNENLGKRMEKLVKEGDCPLLIEFRIDHNPSDRELAFFEVPWELLADENDFLAAQMAQYCPLRRSGAPGQTLDPSEYRLSLVFMAAAPENSVELNYEDEEASILAAAGQEKNLDLTVEESGHLNFLAECVSRETPDVLHISCHGHNEPDPVLQFETLEGDADAVDSMRFYTKMGNQKPPLLFISACKTSQPNRLLTSFSTDLLQR